MQDALPEAAGPLPAAVLLHRDAPGGTHFDVLLAVRAPAGDDDRACATWRTAQDPGLLEPGTALEVEPIQHHRARYLRLADPVELGAGRGTASTVRRGTWCSTAERRLELRWDDGTVTRIEAESPTRWRIA